jgi:hypothetical protein
MQLLKDRRQWRWQLNDDARSELAEGGEVGGLASQSQWLVSTGNFEAGFKKFKFKLISLSGMSFERAVLARARLCQGRARSVRPGDEGLRRRRPR